jgi:hypothetical protein
MRTRGLLGNRSLFGTTGCVMHMVGCPPYSNLIDWLVRRLRFGACVALACASCGGIEAPAIGRATADGSVLDVAGIDSARATSDRASEDAGRLDAAATLSWRGPGKTHRTH